MMTGKERFLRVVRGEEVDRVPVFPLLMFLAADRAGISYREFATNGEAFAEAQVLCRDRFGLDAITACSDAFRISADLGGEMAYPESKPPYLVEPIVNSESDLARLGRPDPTRGRMGDRVRAVSAMARAAGDETAVLGWVEMPFAEACDWVGLTNFMLLLVDAPELAHRILEKATELNIEFAFAQMDAGADMIGAGDAAASLISNEMFREFALPYERRVCDEIHSRGGLVKLHICGNTTDLLESMAESDADLFNVDHMVPLKQARDVYAAAGKSYKGNLDPVAEMMQATPEECRAKARECIELARGTKYMLSAGCEIPAETPDEVFRAFCESVR